MGVRMKYVMNKDQIPARFVLIPDNGMKHSDVYGHWTSAGFVSINYRDKRCHCFGKSVSLGLNVVDGDADILEQYLFSEYRS